MGITMFCISISHKITPLIIRELFSFSKEEQIEFEKHMIESNQITGCVIISTCNRSEIYFSGDKNVIAFVEKEIGSFKNIDMAKVKKYLNIYTNEGALRHLFQVTSGLDSMVLGEDEILRQVKEAYQVSLNNNCTNHELNIAFQGALNNAKLIKTDTKLSKTSVSIGTLTANHIMDFLNSVQGKNILIIGITGVMGSIIANNLACKSDLKVVGTSRNHNAGKKLFVNDNIRIVDYNDRYQYLNESDVIVSATISPHYTFAYNEVLEEFGENTYHKLFIDLAVPCDIDKEILDIAGMDIIDIDYFEKVSKDKSEIKLKEIDKAELILADSIDETLKNIYFQKFNGIMKKVEEKIEEKGFNYFLYQMKKSLNSEQFKTVLYSLQEIAGEVD